MSVRLVLGSDQAVKIGRHDLAKRVVAVGDCPVFQSQAQPWADGLTKKTGPVPVSRARGMGILPMIPRAHPPGSPCHLPAAIDRVWPKLDRSQFCSARCLLARVTTGDPRRALLALTANRKPTIKPPRRDETRQLSRYWVQLLS